MMADKMCTNMCMLFPPEYVDCVEAVLGPFTGEQAGKYGGVNEALGYKGEEGSSLTHIQLRFQR